jgi:5-methylcytosine-specific restriction endonuclease McrA
MVESTCALCGRRTSLTFHHLIPRCLHGKRLYKERFTKEELKSRGILICHPCHRHIHRLYDEKTLGQDFFTLERLKDDLGVQKFARWIRKKK